MLRAIERQALARHEVVRCAASGAAAKVLVGCGQAVPGLDVRIVDPGTGAERPAGCVGEVWVSGPSVGQGYWDCPEETHATFRAELAGAVDARYLRTGDLGFLEDGELYITGRIKELIKIRGRNHYPQDLETAVEGCHPCVRDGAAVAVGVTDETDSTTRLLILHEVNRHHRPGDRADAVRRTIRQRIAERFELEVQTVVLVQAASLPKTSSGKSRRLECLQDYQAARWRSSRNRPWRRRLPSRPPGFRSLPRSRDGPGARSWTGWRRGWRTTWSVPPPRSTRRDRLPALASIR